MRVSDSHGIRDRNVVIIGAAGNIRIASSAACRSNATGWWRNVIDKGCLRGEHLLTQDITPRMSQAQGARGSSKAAASQRCRFALQRLPMRGKRVPLGHASGGM